MPMSGEKHRLTREDVELAPDAPGVYALYGGNGDGVAFYGAAHGDQTIRSRLAAHLSGRERPGPGAAETFGYEVTRFPMARTLALLEEHRRHHRRLPPYNEPPAGSRLLPQTARPSPAPEPSRPPDLA